MNFVMSGHKGLIGSFLLGRLKEIGHKPVLLIDKRDNGNVNDIDRLKLNENVDVFIHLAAFCKINKSIQTPDVTFDDNVKAIFQVMEFCRKNKIPKVVFTSSSRVLSPEKNPYTASKMYGEELVKAYSECYGIDYVIIRPSTVYGPFNDFTQRLIDIFVINALNGEELKIYGDREKTLDFTYIDDFIDGFLIAMDQKNVELNIASGKGTKVEYIADLIIKLVGKGRKTFQEIEIAQPQEVEVDISGLVKLGYEPKISIEEGVKRCYEWYRDNLSEIMESRIILQSAKTN